MKDLELTLSIRNNRLKERRLKLGLTQRQLAKACGMSQQTYAQFERFYRAAMVKGKWVSNAIRLSQFFGISPEELWPESVRCISESRSVSTKVDAPELLSSGDLDRLPIALPSPHEEAEKAELQKEVRRQLKLAAKNDRAREIVEHRFGFHDGVPKTIEEVSEIYGISRERVRQIESVTLRNMRGAGHAEVKKLREHHSCEGLR